LVERSQAANLARYFAPQKGNTVAFLSALLSPDREA
jgi:hypothetical protein